MNRVALVALCSLSFVLSSQAQDRISKPPAGKAPTPAKPSPKQPTKAPFPPVPDLPPVTPVKLADEPFKIASVGLTMRLPADVLVQTTGTGDLTATQIMPKDKTWLISIRTPVTRTTKSAADVGEEVRDQLLATAAPMEKRANEPLKNAPSRARMLQNLGALTVSTEQQDQARPASRFYVVMPRGEKDPPVVRGYTVFEVGPGRYTTFDLTAPEQMFAPARAAYETCIATARFTDPRALEASRASAVDTGMAFITGLTGADYDAACGAMKDQWFRLSKPQAGAEDQEIAYRRVRAWKGKRGEIDTARDPKRWGVEDRQEGYVVRIDARFLQGQKVIDSVGTYFMTPDRREEAWLLQMMVRDPAARKPSTWREVGARSGTSMSVSMDGSGESKVSQPKVPEVGYLNQVEAFLLPQLLTIGRPAEGGMYGFYAYQSESSMIHMRKDTLARSTSGGWTITTQLTENREPQTSTFGETGLLVRTVTADGGVWTPIALPKLAEIWRAKKLPMN